MAENPRNDKPWNLTLSDGSDPLAFAAAVMGKHVSELEHLRRFDTPEKVKAEIARLESERKAKRAASA